MDTLRLFTDVARHRSFSRAAAERHVSQSAVSQRIGQLERRLGVQLLDRSVRPLQLTAAGEAFQRGCQDLLDRYDRLQQAVAGHQIEGLVRVSAIYSAGIDLLSHVRERFASKHPQASVSVDYSRPEGVHAAVRGGLCDVGIVSYPRTWRDVAVIGLRDEPMVVVCRPAHPLAGHDRVPAAGLNGWAMVAFERQLPVARHIRRYLKAHGATPEVDAVFDNIDTIKAAVAVTDRLAILPRRTVSRETAAGTLATVGLDPLLVRPMGIIHTRRRGVLSAAVGTFIDLLLEHAGPGAPAPDALPQTDFVGAPNEQAHT